MKPQQLTALLAAFGFLLGVQNGRVALWRDGCSQPVQVFPYLAENLPAADRKALEQGIRLESREELIRLLEDYLS